MVENTSREPTTRKSSIVNPKSAIASLCLIALLLRLPPAFENRFHADEALYATWAMQVASGRDVLLRDAPIDKPPLAIYTMAASFALFGRSEIAARLPNLIASVVSVVLVWLWARDLRPSSSVLGPNVAAIVMALSPLNIALAGTAFLDPLMVMWGLAACVASTRGRGAWAGVFLGLSFATKVQGLLFAPLVLLPYAVDDGTWMNTDDTDIRKESAFIHFYLRPIIVFTIMVSLILLWDRARDGVPFWVQQTSNYGGIRFAFASEVVPRLEAWLGWLPYLFGALLDVLTLAGLPILLFNAFARDARTRQATIDLYLICYTIGFLALHWLFAFPVWDRYLLILVPVGALVLARLAAIASRRQIIIAIPQKAMLLGIVLLMLPYAIQSARSELPIGGDHGAHDGIDQLADYLRDLPVGTVVYDHWLGWELGFYLWDAGVYRAYFDTPAALADDLHTFASTAPRYLIAPASESLNKVSRAIAHEGYSLTQVLTTSDRFVRTSYFVYEVSKNR